MRRGLVVASAFTLVIATVASCFDWAALSPSTADAGFALALQGGCAVLGEPDGSTIALSPGSFTVSLWISVAAGASGPIVWEGGTTLGEAGWSLDVDASGPAIDFCVANETTTPSCVQAPITASHAIHVAMTSAPGTVDRTRSMRLYTLDWTAGETSHTLATPNNGAVNTWTASSVFTLGGAFGDSGCARTSHVTLGALRVWPTVLDAQTLDTNFNKNISCGALSADFPLDEGMGNVANDCSKSEPPLTLIQPFAWVPSPFP